MPIKRTAPLGHFNRESAFTHLARTAAWFCYSGDDKRFECVFRSSREIATTENRAKNRDLLDHGTLYVDKFHEDGRGSGCADGARRSGT